MIKEFQGKRYYIELRNEEELDYIQNLLTLSETLKDYVFNVKRVDNNLVIYSECGLEEFRGKKYSEWERIKRSLYLKRKKG